MTRSDDVELVGFDVVAYKEIRGPYYTLESDPERFPLSDAAMLTVDYATVGILYSDDTVEYRTFSNGPYDDLDDLESDVIEWYENGTP